MNAEIVDLARTLADAGRRIDNMRILLREKEDLRDRTVEQIRTRLGRQNVETRPTSLKADQAAERRCAVTGRRIAAGRKAWTVRLVYDEGGKPHAVAAFDALLLDHGALDLPAGWRDGGQRLASERGAKLLGAGWSVPEKTRRG